MTTLNEISWVLCSLKLLDEVEVVIDVKGQATPQYGSNKPRDEILQVRFKET